MLERVHLDRYFAFVGFTLSFLFLLAIVALAFTAHDLDRVPPPSIAKTEVK